MVNEKFVHYLTPVTHHRTPDNAHPPLQLQGRGDPHADRAIICPCIYHKDEIAQDGQCHCQLYYRKDSAEKMPGGKE